MRDPEVLHRLVGISEDDSLREWYMSAISMRRMEDYGQSLLSEWDLPCSRVAPGRQVRTVWPTLQLFSHAHFPVAANCQRVVHQEFRGAL